MVQDLWGGVVLIAGLGIALLRLVLPDRWWLSRAMDGIFGSCDCDDEAECEEVHLP